MLIKKQYNLMFFARKHKCKSSFYRTELNYTFLNKKTAYNKNKISDIVIACKT